MSRAATSIVVAFSALGGAALALAAVRGSLFLAAGGGLMVLGGYLEARAADIVPRPDPIDQSLARVRLEAGRSRRRR